jgi:DNA-binding transcriptional MerR regulator
MQRSGSLDWLEEMIPDQGRKKQAVYRIGDLARDFNLTLRTLRFYEDCGLLRPARQKTARLYSPADRARLKVVLMARSAGFPVAEIKELMALYDKSATGESQEAAFLDRFTAQLGKLRQQRAEIDQSIGMLEKAVGALRG